MQEGVRGWGAEGRGKKTAEAQEWERERGGGSRVRVMEMVQDMQHLPGLMMGKGLSQGASIQVCMSNMGIRVGSHLQDSQSHRM